MKTITAIIVGTFIWFFGIMAYTSSFYIPIMENVEQQANLVLLCMVPFIVWIGCYYYYKKGVPQHGLLTGGLFFLTAALLDTLITVPLLVLPNGGSYHQFFTDSFFWIIGVAFIATTVLYWSVNVKGSKREFI